MIVYRNDLIENIVRDLISGSQINIPDDFKEIIIKIEGADQDGTIDARTAQSIVRLQQVIHRLAAFSLVGPDATAKDLSADQLSNLRLKFSARPGCTEISAKLLKIFAYFLTEYTKGMTPAQKQFILFLCLCTFLGYIGITSAFDYMTQSAELQARVLQSQEETKRLQTVLDYVHTAGEAVAIDFGKSAKGATSLRVGARSFDEEALLKLQRRSEKAPAEFDNSTGVYTVIGVRIAGDGRLLVELKSVDTGEETSALVSSSDLFADGEDDAPKTTSAIADYIDNKKPVNVTMLIKITKSRTERLITSWTPLTNP